MYRRYIVSKYKSKFLISPRKDYQGKFIAEFSADLSSFTGTFYIGEVSVCVKNGRAFAKKAMPSIKNIDTDLHITNIYVSVKENGKEFVKCITKAGLLRHNLIMKDKFIEKWADKFNKHRTL